jgi:hypothetical protein
MAEPAAGIMPADGLGQSDSPTPRPTMRFKRKTVAAPGTASDAPADPAPEEIEQHELDTMA